MREMPSRVPLPFRGLFEKRRRTQIDVSKRRVAPIIKRAGAAFVRLPTPADSERIPRMKAPIYLLAAVMLLAASCGDSNNKGPELLFVQTSDGATLTDSTRR